MYKQRLIYTYIYIIYIQRLEFSSAAAQNSSNHVHLEIFRDVRARLMSELSYSIPDRQ